MEEVLLFFGETEESLASQDEILGQTIEDRMVYLTEWVNEQHSGGYTYLESIANFVKYHDMDEERVVKYISPSLKDKIYMECLELNMIKGAKDAEYRIF